MGFQSIFAWKALPEAAFVKKAVIDTHRSKHESIASGWLHGSARPILPQASPVWKVRNLPHCCLRARESVRRASGFVQISIKLIDPDGKWPILNECTRSNFGQLALRRSSRPVNRIAIAHSDQFPTPSRFAMSLTTFRSPERASSQLCPDSSGKSRGVKPRFPRH
jgi:hypothetical protein